MTTPTAARGRAPLFVGVGCIGCLGLVCLGSVVAFLGWRYLVGLSATGHAVTFFQALGRRDTPSAYAWAIAPHDTDLYPLATFTTCIEATPLATMTEVLCHGADVSADVSRARVPCTLTTPTGPIEVTLDVNDPVHRPYNGFVWFSPGTRFGPAWRSDACLPWSGRDDVGDPPVGRARP